MASNESREILTRLDYAVSAELRAILAAVQWSRSDFEKRTGIKRTRLRETVFDPTRSLRLSEVEAISQALGMLPTDLIRRSLYNQWRTATPDSVPLRANGEPDYDALIRTVTPSQDDYDLVAKRMDREPDGDDEGFM